MSGKTKTLVSYVLPTVLGNCSYFLFTIVDGVFVGRGVSTDALGAINIVWPFVMVINACVMLTVIGGVTVTAIRLGRGDVDGANQAFMHSLSGTVLIGLAMCLAGTCFTSAITTLLGANDTYFAMVREYLFYYSLFAVPASLFTCANNFCRNDGAPVLVSVGVMVASGTNIFLDWLFIFPLHMGLMGAAVATGIAQTLGMLIVASHFLRRQGQLRLRRFRLSAALVKKLLTRGLPETVAQFCSPLAILCTNYVLLARLGDVAVNAFSIIGYVATFSIAVFFGVSEGLQPLIGRCYGAKDGALLKYYFHSGLLINLVSSTVIFSGLLLVSRQICALFGADALTLDYTVRCLPLYAWGFIVMSQNTMISAYLYSTKRSREALLLNTCRSLVFNTLTILLLPIIFGSNAVWLTMGVYELLSLTLAFVLVKRSEKNGVDFH